jgi:thiol-disulfide isomerase/thioredoxin
MVEINENDMVSADIITSDLDLTPEFVASKLRGKKGLILLVYSDGCPACRVFKDNSFITFMNEMNSQGDLLVKALPLHQPGIGMAFNNKVQTAPVKKFEVMYIPTVLSFDSNGKFFSTYGSSGPEHINKYRSIEDLREYASRVGDYTVDFKVSTSN